MTLVCVINRGVQSMSRTYRRKGSLSTISKVWHNYSQFNRDWLVKKNPKAKSLKEAIFYEESKYHRDNHSGEYNYTQYGKRQFKIYERVMFKAQLSRFFQYPETEIQSFPFNKVCRHFYYD